MTKRILQPYDPLYVRTLTSGREVAAQTLKPSVRTEHLFIGLIINENIASWTIEEILRSSGTVLMELEEELEKALRSQQRIRRERPVDKIKYSNQAHKVLKCAESCAISMSAPVSCEHFVLASFDFSPSVNTLLARMGIRRGTFEQRVPRRVRL